MNIFENTQIAFQHQSNKQLRKAYYLFKMIENPTLTRIGIVISQFLLKIRFPLVQKMIKNTLYEQFCGGETLDDSLPSVHQMYKYGVYSILDYSVEGKAEEDSFKRTYEEVLENIDWAKEKPEIPFVVFKPTGIGNIEIYKKIGAKIPLSEEEKIQYQTTLERFDTIAQKAAENNVPLMVDAEESWMQDAADTIIEELMQKYNTQKTIVCNTLQMYRHDRLKYLKEQYQKAVEGNYYLGLKVVRGAYMEKERERALDQGYPSPIQPDKEATDRDYNLAIAFCLQHHDRISLYAGTHNEKSCQLLMNELEQQQLPSNYHKIWFGQLYGMSDNLSYNLAYNGYNVAKYLPYGPVQDVVPYLARRAQENTSVAGQTGRELALIQRELKRRKRVS